MTVRNFVVTVSFEFLRIVVNDVFLARDRSQFRRRFKWLKPELFGDDLADDLCRDAKALMNVLTRAGGWDADRDAKLGALLTLLSKQHPEDKVLVFSQFADTVNKCPLLQSATDTLNRQLKSGISNQALAELVVSLRADARLCRVAEDVDSSEPQVICSLGLRKQQ